MTVANHAAMGAVIALTLKEPVLVLPLTLISHYALDALPHFGYPGGGGYGEALKHRLTYLFGLFDFLASIVFIILIWGTGWLVYASAFLGVLPDIPHTYRYFFLERKGLSKPGEGNLISHFHHRIQWCERPWGLLIELAFTIFLFTIIINLR